MIRLIVEDYCQNCLNFKPEVEMEKLYPTEISRNNIINDTDETMVINTVTCVSSRRCAAQVRYLERRYKAHVNASE